MSHFEVDRTNFQGRFSSSGTYTGGDGTLKFRILDGAGNPVGGWSETYANPNFGPDGVYNVILGDQSQISTSIFTGSNVVRKLEVNLGNGQAISTATLVSVPFAFRTFYADELAGGSTVQGTLTVNSALRVDTNTLFVDSANDRVGVGTASPSHKLQVSDGAVVGSSLTVSGTDLSGTSAVLQVAGSTLVVQADGKIGMGTNAPGYKVDVQSSAIDLEGIQVLNTNGDLNTTTSAGVVFKVTNSAGATRSKIAAVEDCAGSDCAQNSLIFLTGLTTGGTPTEKMRIRYDGNVGIGTSSPDNKLDVSGTLEVGAGSRGATLSSSGGDNFQLQTWTNTPNPNFAIAAGNGSGGTSSTVWVEGESSTLRLMKNGGNVGIGTTSPDQLLSVNGNASKTGGSTWLSFSDSRLKKDITPYSDGLNMIKEIKPVKYRYNGKMNLPTDEEYIGVIAQDMITIAPYTVITSKGKLNEADTVETEIYSFDANALIYALINSVKELNQEIGLLKGRINAIENK